MAAVDDMEAVAVGVDLAEVGVDLAEAEEEAVEVGEVVDFSSPTCRISNA